MAQPRVIPVSKPVPRLDRYLHEVFPAVSVNGWRRRIAVGQVLVDGRPGRKGLALTPGRRIQLLMEAGPDSLRPEFNGELEIVYQDAELIAVNKPAGCHCHPQYGDETGTMANLLLAAFPELSQVKGFGPLQAGLLHRLDFATSGLLLAARTDAAWNCWRRCFEDRQLQKHYLAEVEGELSRSQIISEKLTHDAHDRRRMRVIPPAAPCRGVFAAVTEVGPLDYQPESDSSLVGLVMATGVMHQLRAHLAFVGHPLLGDTLYGAVAEAANGLFHLHCRRLVLPDGRQIAAPLPSWCKSRMEGKAGLSPA